MWAIFLWFYFLCISFMLTARRFCSWSNSGRFWRKLGRPHGQNEESVDNGLVYILFSVFMLFPWNLKKKSKLIKLRARLVDVCIFLELLHVKVLWQLLLTPLAYKISNSRKVCDLETTWSSYKSQWNHSLQNILAFWKDGWTNLILFSFLVVHVCSMRPGTIK